MNHNFIKTFLAIVLLTFVASAVAAQTCAPARVGLTASYSGENNALDARSRNNGTLENGAAFAPGYAGQGFSFDGADDQVTIPHAPNQNTDNITIEAWINPVALNHGGTIVQKRTSGNAGGYLLEPTQPSGAGAPDGLQFVVQSNGGSYVTLNPANVLTAGVWQHVAATFDGTMMRIYVNGTLVGSQALGNTTIQPVVAPIVIGRNAVNGTGFSGKIDELAIYNRALSASDIQAIYSAGAAGKCKPIAPNAPENQVLWLAGDGDANDVSGNGNNGVIAGASFHAGKVGQAFHFNGASNITVPDSPSLRPVSEITFEAWVNSNTGTGGPNFVLLKGNGSSSGGQPYSLFLNSTFTNTNRQVGARIGNDSTFDTLSSNTGIPVNAYTHIAVTYDGTNIRMYLNGVLDASKTTTIGPLAQTDTNPLVIGAGAGTNFSGSVDEVSIYNRALSAGEIESIANAGLAGKYKVQATVPSGIAAWYPGDGDTNDLQAANNASLMGGAAYATARVGQGFFLNGTTAYVQAPSTAVNDPTGAAAGASMEAWVRFNQRPSDAGHQMFMVTKSGFGATEGFDIHVDTDNFFKFVWGGSYTGYPSFQVQTGVWYHVVATFSSDTGSPNAGVRFYANGQLLGIGNVFNPRTASGAPLDIGSSSLFGSNTSFNGIIDEPAIYDRTLTPDEIRALYFAGPGGKFKGASNPTANNRLNTGDAELTFGSITSSGAVHVTPLDGSLFPPLPMGTNTGLNYDISTTASYTNPSVCFNLPSYTPSQFANLRIYHLESGVWADRSAPGSVYPSLCTTGLTSLSPFAIALLAPSAAVVSLSGRVTSQNRGLANVEVKITGGELARPLVARTNPFGYYKFDGLLVGKTYVLSVSSKQYTFSKPTRLINLQDEISDADFVADLAPDRGTGIWRRGKAPTFLLRSSQVAPFHK